ncbi:MAG TPA: hypothetical protein PLY86_22125 [bacterium]|nr:hypothetical protein [bacterium]
MSARLLTSLALVAFLCGCTTSPTQTVVPGILDPRSTVTENDTRALEKQREERRELAERLLSQAEQRSKTQQPNMWNPLGQSGHQGTSSALEPIKILNEPWSALKKAIAPAGSPISVTPQHSLHEQILK